MTMSFRIDFEVGNAASLERMSPKIYSPKIYSMVVCTVALLLMSVSNALSYEPDNVTSARFTQGSLAVKLAERLGMGKDLSPDKAAELLELTPFMPGGKWDVSAELTVDVIVRVQRAVVDMLDRLSKKHKVVPPPTLMTRMLQPPYGQLTITFNDPKTSDTKEGDIAPSLAARLGLGKELAPDEAIEKLLKIGVTVDGGWDVNRKVTDISIFYIQRALYDMIKSSLQEMNFPVPATFTLSVKFLSD